jgi:DNA-binding GntR family transcriptional regulator
MNPHHANRPLLLRTQVYDYLRKKMDNGNIASGEYLNFNEICEALEISRTPVRDALLQLQNEGFVTLLPQRGIQINDVSIHELKDIYEMLGGLESKVLKLIFHNIGPTHISRMKKINEKMLPVSSSNKFNLYYRKNLAFHNVFLNLSKNELVKYHITILKQRLFEFSKRVCGSEWQEVNYSEHKKLIELIEKGDVKIAIDFWDDEHWSFNW